MEVSKQIKLFKSYNDAVHVLRSLVCLRNLCAHHARIWNRRMVVKLANKHYLQKFGDSNEQSQWRIISILMSLVDEINKNNVYSKKVLNLCKQNEEFYKGLIEPTL